MKYILLISSLALQSHAASLVVNGSFENRTSPLPPTSGFSVGIPDDWTEKTTNGRPYLVHESHGTVPLSQAIDGDIILGGAGNLIVSQTITVSGTGALRATWSANNETTEVRDETSVVYDTAIQLNDSSGNFIDWSGYRRSYDDTELLWFDHSFTSTEIFTPGTYQVDVFVGGLASVDHLVVTQIPEPSAPLLAATFGLIPVFFSRRRA